MSVKWGLCLGAGLLLSSLDAVSAAHAAAPCAAGEGPVLELRVVATALANDSDRSLIVRVFDDGCVQVHRPAYRRDAGEFRLDLAPDALDTLKRQVEQPALQNFDAKRVRAEIATAQGKRMTEQGQPQRFSELDGDTHEIHWRSGSKRGSVAWTGLQEQAQLFADNTSLQAFQRAATALQALAERGDAVRIAGGQP